MMKATHNRPVVTVVGAGLAGAEAALQLTRFGIPVHLIDMKPAQFTPAHSNPNFAELVCSNSFRAASLENAVGLLKEELRRLGSVLMQLADRHQVPAGGALAVDRQEFAEAVTETLKTNPLISLSTDLVSQIPTDGLTIIATGPLTAGPLFDDIAAALGPDQLHFFDAAAPIVTAESLDRNIVFSQSRYDKGGADYLNCPMDEAEYQAFWEALTAAEVVPMGGTDSPTVFEGCMPVETMGKRGRETLLFGPLKPVGLIDPRTGKRPYALSLIHI